MEKYKLMGKYKDLKEILRVGNILYFISIWANGHSRYYKGKLNGSKVVGMERIKGAEPLNLIVGLNLRV